eukprot:TRINITY_DN11695_c0_g1_i1.p2 TRINITY_DN11695_c0_g1~~TRINITY_DN11695_c0_g1_i1.p2  ORF type:complete len:359 (+),score=101.10 TRINITY_DN11695_c0_g1_i1:53-1078(+)
MADAPELAQPTSPPTLESVPDREGPYYLTTERVATEAAEPAAPDAQPAAEAAKPNADADSPATPAKAADGKTDGKTPSEEGLNPEAVPWGSPSAHASPPGAMPHPRKGGGGRGTPPWRPHAPQQQGPPPHLQDGRGKHRRGAHPHGPPPPHYYGGPAAGPYAQYASPNYPSSYPPHGGYHSDYNPYPPTDLSHLVTYPPSAPLPPSFFSPTSAYPPGYDSYQPPHYMTSRRDARPRSGKGRQGGPAPQGKGRHPQNQNYDRRQGKDAHAADPATENALFNMLSQHGLGALLKLLTMGGVSSIEALAACTKEQIDDMVHNPENRERLYSIVEGIRKGGEVKA